MKKKTETDWQRLEAMSDDDLDTSEIRELTEDFFDYAEFRTAYGKPCTVKYRLKIWMRLWFFWLPALIVFIGVCYWLWAEFSLWSTDPFIAFACAMFPALLVATICFSIHFGWGD